MAEHMDANDFARAYGVDGLRAHMDANGVRYEPRVDDDHQGIDRDGGAYRPGRNQDEKARAHRGDGTAKEEKARGVVVRGWRRQNTATMPARDFLYGRLLQRGKVTLTVAPGGMGKSALTGATEALAMATGRRLLHDDVPRALRVWVWNLEEDQDELNRRLEAACSHFRIAGEVDGLFVSNGFEMPCRMAAQTRDGVTVVRPLTDAIVAEIKRQRIDVLVVDPFVSTHQVNENDNGAIDIVAREWARVAHEGGCAIHLVHHTYKLHGVEATADAARGASSLVGAVRVARALNPMSGEEAAGYGIKEAWRYFRATDAKANYAPRADESQWFCHASVHLPNGDNVGVVAPFTPPDAMAGVTTDHLDEVLRRAGDRDFREAVQSPDWIGHMIADVMGVDPDDATGKRKVRSSLAAWLKSGALRVVEKLDPKRRMRRFIVPGFVAEDIEVGGAAGPNDNTCSSASSPTGAELEQLEHDPDTTSEDDAAPVLQSSLEQTGVGGANPTCSSAPVAPPPFRGGSTTGVERTDQRTGAEHEPAHDHSVPDVCSDGQPNEPSLPTLRDRVLAILTDAFEPLSLGAIAAALPDADYGAINGALHRMMKDGAVVRPSRGKYTRGAN